MHGFPFAVRTRVVPRRATVERRAARAERRRIVESTYAPDRYEGKEIAALEETLQERVNDLCRKMRDEGYATIDYRESEPEVTEYAEANDYEFDEEGRPA